MFHKHTSLEAFTGYEPQASRRVYEEYSDTIAEITHDYLCDKVLQRSERHEGFVDHCNDTVRLARYAIKTGSVKRNELEVFLREAWEDVLGMAEARRDISQDVDWYYTNDEMQNIEQEA